MNARISQLKEAIREGNDILRLCIDSFFKISIIDKIIKESEDALVDKEKHFVLANRFSLDHHGKSCED